MTRLYTEKSREYNRNYYILNKTKIKERSRRWRENNPHVNGYKGGHSKRVKNKEGGYALYAAILRKEKNIKDYQLLCSNCNWIKRVEEKRETWRRG